MHRSFETALPLPDSVCIPPPLCASQALRLIYDHSPSAVITEKNNGGQGYKDRILMTSGPDWPFDNPNWLPASGCFTLYAISRSPGKPGAPLVFHWCPSGSPHSFRISVFYESSGSFPHLPAERGFLAPAGAGWELCAESGLQSSFCPPPSDPGKVEVQLQIFFPISIDIQPHQ